MRETFLGDDEQVDQEALSMAVGLFEDPNIRKGGVKATLPDGTQVVVLCGLARNNEDEDDILLVPWAVLLDDSVIERLTFPEEVRSIMYRQATEHTEEGEDSGSS